MIDPISEMLTNIRNAIMARHSEVVIPRSKMKIKLAEILKEEGYINNVEIIKDGPQGHIKMTLRYADESKKQSPVHEITTISKPGQRIYVKSGTIPRVKNGLGINIISTSQGLMTDNVARKRKLGGELICRVW
ncbi:30S ribosomal protein S8 [Patescibacteria group bacterium]